MHELLVIIGAVLACLVSAMAVARFNFYTKDEIDKSIAEIKEASDEKDQTIQVKLESNHNQISKESVETKDSIYEKLLEVERLNNKQVQEIYDRLNANKQIFDDYNRNMLEAIAQLKADEKEITTNMVQIVNAVKDELKNDYITRYNDLLKLLGTKTNVEDFNRLEQKFDKISESITELKTIMQLKLNDTKEKQ